MLAQSNTAEAEPFWRDVDPHVASSLEQFQKDEILAAISRRADEMHPADVRLSLFGYFLVILCGRERRSQQRLQTERQRRPVFSVKNLPVLVILWGSVIYTAFSFILPAVRDLLAYFL